MAQKEIHFGLTYALARKIGISAKQAEIIAWSNQFTDDLTTAELYGIQTQSAILGNWNERQIQLSVLVPFHFLPGDDLSRPWIVTQNSARARALVKTALPDIFQFGIALHALQDSFFHQDFTGWQDKINACYHLRYIIQSAIPNIGHAEMQATPDIVNAVWTDPRDGRRIDNRRRALSCAKTTYDFLVKFAGSGKTVTTWQELAGELKQIFRLNSYDRRKAELHKLSGNKRIRYTIVNKRLEPIYKPEFIKAARSHLAETIKSFGDLPKVNA